MRLPYYQQGFVKASFCQLVLLVASHFTCFVALIGFKSPQFCPEAFWSMLIGNGRWNLKMNGGFPEKTFARVNLSGNVNLTNTSTAL